MLIAALILGFSGIDVVIRLFFVACRRRRRRKREDGKWAHGWLKLKCRSGWLVINGKS